MQIFEQHADQKQLPGLKMISKLLNFIEEQKDFWLVYELGSAPLSKHLFEVKGEFYKGERIYNIQHQAFYSALRTDKSVLKDFIRKMAFVFSSLAKLQIVHADIKPDNILVDFDGTKLHDLKLIDFGSSFVFSAPTSVSASTPEYLAPEVLDYLETRATNPALSNA